APRQPRGLVLLPRGEQPPRGGGRAARLPPPLLPRPHGDARGGEPDRLLSRRATGPSPRPELVGEWTVGEPLPSATPDSLDFFLTERYCLYTTHADRLYRSRI